MLQSIHIQNYALIESLDIDFHSGFSVITGETGAGKSIIIGSINLALGQKVPKELLKDNDEPALVELYFNVDDKKVIEKLQALDIEVEDGSVILSRKITSGKAIARINGEAVSAATLKEVASGFSVDSEANLFITLTQQWGGEYTKFDANGKGQYAFNNSQSKAAMAFFKENFDKGYFASATYFGADYSSDAFKAQQCIMTIGSSAGASYNSPTDGSFEAGVAAYPQKDMNNAQVIQQGTNVSLFKCSNPQEELAGWLFMKFLTNFDSALRWCTETAYFPIRKDVLNSTEYAEHISGIIRDETTGELIERPNTVQLAQKVGLTQQGWFYSNVAFKGSSAARDNAEIIVDQILYGNKSIDDAYKEAMNDLLS